MLPTNDPVILIQAALYLALIFLVGYAVVCWSLVNATPASPSTGDREEAAQASQLQAGEIRGIRIRHWVELISVSFAIGAGVLPLILFLISIIGFKPSRGVLIGIAIVAMFVLLWRWKKTGLLQPSVPTPRHKFDPLTLLGFLSAGLIVVSMCNIAVHAAWPGLQDIDAFAIWMLKAKWVSLDALRPMPAGFSDPILSYSHQDYPLSLPFLTAGLYAAIGHIDDNAAKLLLVPIWLSLTGMMYAAIRRFHRRAMALAITALFATAPTLTQNAALLVAETPLMLALAGAATQLLRWMEEGEGGDLILAGLFAAIAAFTKNEGLAMMPIFGFAALIHTLRNAQTPVSEVLRRAGSSDEKPGASEYLRTGVQKKLNDLIRAAVICAIAITPWLIYRTHLPRTHEDYGSKLLHPSIFLQNLPQRTSIFTQYLARLFDAPRVGLIWFILILTTILSPRALLRTSTRILWCILLIQLSLYLATFIVTPWDLQILVPMITPKLQTQASAIAALVIAMNLRDRIGI